MRYRRVRQRGGGKLGRESTVPPAITRTPKIPTVRTYQLSARVYIRLRIFYPILLDHQHTTLLCDMAYALFSTMVQGALLLLPQYRSTYSPYSLLLATLYYRILTVRCDKTHTYITRPEQLHTSYIDVSHHTRDPYGAVHRTAGCFRFFGRYSLGRSPLSLLRAST